MKNFTDTALLDVINPAADQWHAALLIAANGGVRRRTEAYYRAYVAPIEDELDALWAERRQRIARRQAFLFAARRPIWWNPEKYCAIDLTNEVMP